MKDEEENLPDFAKATITKKMKDHEVQRIADETTQKFTAKTIASEHNTMRKTKRIESNFQNTRMTGLFAAQKIKKHEKAVMD